MCHLYPYNNVKLLRKFFYININMASCASWHPTTDVDNQADCHLSASVVSCGKQSATLGTCCSQSMSVVLMMPKSNRKQTEPAKTINSVNSC